MEFREEDGAGKPQMEFERGRWIVFSGRRKRKTENGS